MIARRMVFLTMLLTAACGTAWGQAVTISPASLPVGGGQFTLGQAIPTQQLSTNFNDPNAWSISAGNLPPGLTLDPAGGTITGTPTLAGAFTFTVAVFDQELQRQGVPRQYTVYVNTGSPLSLTPLTPPPPGGAVGSTYASFTFEVAGGVPGYTWALQSGTSVNGLTLDSSTGLLSGIPLAGGVFPIGVTVTDASRALISASFNLNVLGITTASLPAGAIGVPYSQTLTSVGATGPLTWSLNPPVPGLSLDPVKGIISGTPTTLGTYPFQIHVADSTAKLTATQSFSISVTSATSLLTVTTTSPLPNASLGVAFSQTLQATGGATPYTWSATGLPAWLQLDPVTGILSGTPTTGGTSTISVTVTDAARGTATASLSLTVGALVISPATLPNGTVGVAYPATTLTVAGTTVTNWAVTVGTLPAGLALDSSTGIISGKPTAAGSSTFTITATIGNRAAVATVVQAYTVLINPAVSVTISGLPPVGVAATQSPAAVTLSGPSPVTTSGTLTLAFTPAGGGTQPFDAKFASGSPYTANFTIAAGSTQGLFSTTPFTSVPVMIGTVAGTITITTTLQDSTLTAPAPVVMTVNPTVPVITSVIPCAVTLTGFSISVTGRSTPRDMSSALFHFTLPTNTQPSTLDVTVPLTTAFAGWYSNPSSNAFGSTFKMTAQFSFTGPPGATVPFTAVTATMTNSVGASTPPVAGQSAVSVCP